MVPAMKMQLTVKLGVSVLLQILSSLADTHYVRPTTTPPSHCPGQLCLTLHQYALASNITSDTTLMFLSGNHLLEELTLILTDVSNITLKSDDNGIISFVDASIHCDNVSGLHINGLKFSLFATRPVAIQLISCTGVNISNTEFSGSIPHCHATPMTALHSIASDITIWRCKFQGNCKYHLDLTIFKGGAVHVEKTLLTICKSYFINNIAASGGAVFGYMSTIVLDGNHFFDNIAEVAGAISFSWCIIWTRNKNTFSRNLRLGNVSVKQSKLGDGAVVIKNSEAVFRGEVTFFNNSPAGMHADKSNITFAVQHLHFSSNKPHGAMYIEESTVTFSGNTSFTENTAVNGGGLEAADQSTIIFIGHTSFLKNHASDSGGGLRCEQGYILFLGITIFTQNTAASGGGGISATGTAMTIEGEVHLSLNSADKGGAMYLEGGASLIVASQACQNRVYTALNNATSYGGAIYYFDSPTRGQCQRLSLPRCFLQKRERFHCLTITSIEDSAGRAGNFLYGGLLDRCVIENRLPIIDFYDREIEIRGHDEDGKRSIESDSYMLCLNFSLTDTVTGYPISSIDIGHYCRQQDDKEVYRGQQFRVSLISLGQSINFTPATVLARTSATARLETYQTSQPLLTEGHTLNYTVYSAEAHEEVVLFPDGPCRDIGAAKLVIDVTLLPCPRGFVLSRSGEVCVCEDRLQPFQVKCTIDDTPYLTKLADSKFWMGVPYENTTYEGLVLGKTCPAEYCKIGPVNVTLDDPDVQCALNRSGLLCGACAANHSLMLGSSQCQVCPNTFLALLLPFAAAGIALVALMTFLRLTVATGVLNSVILYANIVQANKRVFFPANTRNLLTVFIAWLNLDLGFQTCFYDGLDAYALTWLQFAFPLYTWLLMVLIILVSRYSLIVSKLIGSNPVAVLATLLLMSYTKILKIIIEVYSSVDLDYPGNGGNGTVITVPVWLKDANVPYLQSRHLLLTVVTSVVLVFLFLPYTLLLLLGHKLYRFTGRKHCRWLNRLKPLLDSYYGPYKRHTRYWTGFLLLVRCVLYVLFLLRSVSISKSLLAINITFSAIGLAMGLIYSGRIYKDVHINATEVFVYFDLILLSATSQIGLTSAALVYSLVGLVFVILMVFSAHQFHLLYIAKTALWRWVREKWSSHWKKPQPTPSPTPLEPVVNPSHDPHRIVTKTVIDLREPLLTDQ